MIIKADKGTHRVVIIGGGFGGLYAAKALRKAPVDLTLVDKRNFHLFQPLLYQVATGGLSPEDIAYPLRAVLNRSRNTRVITAEVVDIDPDRRKVILSDGEMNYDTLIIAAGMRHHYFGHDEWAAIAPGLKTIEDALEIRRRILISFEKAERETDPQKRRMLLTFVIIGGGPTGVELAGALCELAYNTMKRDFRNFDPADTVIYLLEGTDRLLPEYPPSLSAQAEAALAHLGTTVWTRTLLTDIKGDTLVLRREPGGVETTVRTNNVLWATGVQASPMGHILATRAGAELDRIGRVYVEPDLTVGGHSELFVIGDLAHFAHQSDKPLPGVAPVAMQQGEYVARLIRKRLAGKTLPAFHYRDKGSLAVIGRNAAVADMGCVRVSGFIAWILWIFVHIRYLIGFDNKMLVLMRWAFNYLTRKRGARLITGKDQ